MKERLDILIAQKNLARSRSEALDLIKRGLVSVNGEVATKPSQKISVEAEIIINRTKSFVSRGGEKLEHALKTFNINVENKIALDIGSSTGGFTDCLLQNGIFKIYAVDVGTDQLEKSILNNPKVISLEKQDIRTLEIEEKVDLIVIDVSFISIKLVLAKATSLLKTNGEIIALIKPQFEVGKENTKNGIVKDPKLQERVLKEIVLFTESLGLDKIAEAESPILGGDGNKEFLLYLKKS